MWLPARFYKAPKIILHVKSLECITSLTVLAPFVPDVGKRYPPDNSADTSVEKEPGRTTEETRQEIFL